MAVIEQKMTDLTEIQSPDDVQSFIIHDGTGMKLAPKDLILSGGSSSGGGSALDVAPNSGAHNSIFRGDNLGSTVTEAQWNSIDAGTFDDLFIGDYWEINSVKWRIAAFDYYFRTGSTEVTKHHVTIVPDQVLGSNKTMESSATTQNGYGKSAMFTTNLGDAKTLVNNAFGSTHILNFKAFFSNASSNGKTSGASWYDSTVDLMSEFNVYGRDIFVTRSIGDYVDLRTTDKTQYPLFKLAPEYIIALNSSGTAGSRVSWWLRDIVSSAGFALVYASGYAAYSNANNGNGVRPRFSIIKS